MSVVIGPVAAADLDDLAEPLLAVYQAAFGQEPYRLTTAQLNMFANRIWPRHRRQPGFRLMAARADRTVVGLAYGYDSRPGQWWHDTIARALPSDERRRWLTDAFELVELAVQPEWQGQGIGGRLHDALLAGLAHETAVLSTLDQETAALHLYRRRGWVDLLVNYQFPDGQRRYRIMGRRLPLHDAGRGNGPPLRNEDA